uniref:Peptidase_S8 domain-containing protein n=1 Tax=Heterorhabditis bacteriophora TaxID=37862 RepID=A0A1I7XGM8_HETBA
MKTGLLVILSFIITCIYAIEHDSICDDKNNCPYPTHTVIRLSSRDDELARKLAEQHGMHVKGDVFMDNYYFLYHTEPNRPMRHKRSAIMRLNEHPAVEWIEEQRPRHRVKRDYLLLDDEGVGIINDIKGRFVLSLIIINDKVRSHIVSRRETFTKIVRSTGRSDAETKRRRDSDSVRRIPRLPFRDPLYQDQWYLVGKAMGNFDMNVREAWLMGYAGRNVSVSILDDGIQRDHPDLIANYDPLASTDINDHDDDPTPQNNGDNKHGTRCAGEVAGIADNDQCGVGVAFKAKIGGVRTVIDSQ